MNKLSQQEIDAVTGAGTTFGDISAAMYAAAAVSGGLAAIPTPASPGLVAFGVITGVMGAGAGWIDSHYG